MTMKDMDRRFENAGFKVNREYGEGVYYFAISKGELATAGRFEYRPSDTQEVRHRRQVKFIHELIETFDVEELKYIESSRPYEPPKPPKIKVVHFSGPVTTVIWDDGTKSQVRCQEGDTFDPEKGLALAIAKKALGNKGSWYDDIKKWVDKYYVDTACTDFDFKFRPGGVAHVKYVGPKDSDESKRVDDNNKPASITKPLSNPHRCATCMYVNSPITHGPCSDCSWDYSNWKGADEPQTTHYNPIAEAYAIAVRIRDGLYDEDDTIETIIGFLGEALDT